MPGEGCVAKRSSQAFRNGLLQVSFRSILLRAYVRMDFVNDTFWPPTRVHIGWQAALIPIRCQRWPKYRISTNYPLIISRVAQDERWSHNNIETVLKASNRKRCAALDLGCLWSFKTSVSSEFLDVCDHLWRRQSHHLSIYSRTIVGTDCLNGAPAQPCSLPEFPPPPYTCGRWLHGRELLKNRRSRPRLVHVC